MSTWTDEQHKAERELVALVAESGAVPSSLRTLVIAHADARAARDFVAQGLPVVKSWREADGGRCYGGGWFIVTATLPTGRVRGRYEERHWDLFDVPEVMLSPAWGGRTPEITADRSEAALNTEEN